MTLAAGSELAARRVEAARANKRWLEHGPQDFVVRGPFLVDAVSDVLYRRARGVVFERDSPHAIDVQARREFFVSTSGEVVFVERVQSPKTWSEVVARRARRGVAAA
jgi:hypothetical protein